MEKNKNENTISHRGLAASQSILRVDMDVYFEAVENLFHPEKNPNGTFPLNMAENKLTWHLLRGKIQDINHNNEIPEWVAGYTSGQGALSLRESTARFFSKFLTKTTVDPEHLIFSAGATSVIEMTSLVLGDEGDVVAFPAPCYPVYRQDIANIANLERYDIVTHHDISALKNGPLLDISDLEKAKKEIEAAGKNFKILVLTNPDNPTGGMFSFQHLQKITDWCLEQKIHLIVNEIYGLSLIDTAHPAITNDYSEVVEFVSFAQIMEQRQSDYLHLWYSFSKDFGISGFRIGVAYSRNELFVKAYTNLNYSHLVSNYAQWVLQEILEDENFIQQYISENQKLLTEAYVVVVNALRELDIEYVPSRGSLFVWLDLSDFLEENSQEAENKFWFEIYENTGVLLTPGTGFGHTKRGHFRMVYPYFSKEDLEVAMERFGVFIKKKEALSGKN